MSPFRLILNKGTANHHENAARVREWMHEAAPGDVVPTIRGLVTMNYLSASDAAELEREAKAS